MARYSSDSPPQFARRVRQPDGSVLVYPQVEVPNPLGSSFPSTYKDDPASSPYVESVSGQVAKTKDLSGVRYLPERDGIHQVETDAQGSVVSDKVVGQQPPKGAAIGAHYKSAPDGLHSINADGSLGPVVVAKAAPASAATAASVNARNTSTAALNDARVAAMKQAQWSKVQGELDAIDKQFQDGTLTAEQRDQAKQGVVDDAIQQTVTGMTSPQRATAAYQQGSLVKDLSGQEVTQADTRANNAASILNNLSSEAVKIGAGGGTPAQIADFLQGGMSVAPGFAASMGGAPVGFTPQHFKDLLGLIGSGQVPPDANGNVVPNALKIMAQQAGVRVGMPEGNPATMPVDAPMQISGGGPPPSFGPDSSPVPLPQFTAPAAA